MQKAVCFDDVLLVPQYSDIDSRSSVNLSVSGFDDEYARLTTTHPILKFPVVGSPMDTVTGHKTAAFLADLGGFGVLHRYCSIEESVNEYNLTVDCIQNKDNAMNVMVAVGATGDFLERAQSLYEAGCRAFCIDVAHGHHLHVKAAITSLRTKYSDSIHVMTGNVSTLEAFNDLADWGSNSVRVGVGGGSMCTTRIRTGHGVPTLQSIIDCARSDRDVMIIADGGIRNSGDAVKALAAGADMVMLGSILAGHDLSPGEIVDKNGSNTVLTGRDGSKISVPTSGEHLYKKFRGMASREAQLSWRGKVSVVEGESTLLPYKGELKNTLSDFSEGIKSGLSYSGARNIRELRTKARFVSISPSAIKENNPHGKNL